VASGARQDLGQFDAAVVMLQVAELEVPPTAGSGPARVARARLMSAYSDALEAAGRPDDARVWLERAAAADVDGLTGAADRLGWDGLEPGEIMDLLDDEDDEDGEGGEDGEDGEDGEGVGTEEVSGTAGAEAEDLAAAGPAATDPEATDLEPDPPRR
jgi:hypothetical protein